MDKVSTFYLQDTRALRRGIILITCHWNSEWKWHTIISPYRLGWGTQYFPNAIATHNLTLCMFFFSNFRSQCVFSSIIIQIQNSTLHITDNNSTQDRLLMRRALHYEALNKCVCVCDVPLAPVKFVCPWENCAVLRECVCVCVSATSAISKKLIWFIQEMIQHNGTYNLF